MLKEIEQFNKAATQLRATDFPLPKTPNEAQRMAKNPPKRDYGKLLALVLPLIESFSSATPSDRVGVTSELNSDAKAMLGTFAYQAGLLAVRKGEPILIAQGLTALAILGDEGDVRDVTFHLAVLHHCAVKLGADAERLFGEGASLCTSAILRDEILRFRLRPPNDRALSAFFLRETTTDEMFDVVQNPIPLSADRLGLAHRLGSWLKRRP